MIFGSVPVNFIEQNAGFPLVETTNLAFLQGPEQIFKHVAVPLAFQKMETQRYHFWKIVACEFLFIKHCFQI